MRAPTVTTLRLLAVFSACFPLGCGEGEAAGAGFRDISSRIPAPALAARPVREDYFMPDSMGPGCAFLDFDNDGDLDLYAVAGFQDREGRLVTPEGANRLYRQDPGLVFTDVTAQSGAGHQGYGQGVAVGDVDNDGDLDLYVTNFGPGALLVNRGDGTFEDATERSGIVDPGWGTSCGFFDYDADGFLDLFVARYVAFTPGAVGRDAGGRPDYPSPWMFTGNADALFHNDGDGTFTDVSASSGIGAALGKGLGVVFTDLDGDGRIDLFVANDGEPNFAWIQRDGGRFEERASALGLAVGGFGRPQANMGIAPGDCDGDGDLDLFVTHLVQESNTLFVRGGDGRFEDRTLASGLGAASLDFTGFGTLFLDVELDGDLDLAVVNGSIARRRPFPGAGTSAHWSAYAEPNHLYLNDGAAHFARAKEGCGDFCSAIEVGRGLASGDVDGDGDLDLLVSNGDGTLKLYRNETAREGHWLLVRAFDPALGRDAYGAVIEIEGGGGKWTREISPVQSYLSSSDPRAHFGLGPLSKLERIRVHWPDHSREEFDGGDVDRVVVLNKGAGR
jgi:enediyne biosynthesis protein E4